LKHFLTLNDYRKHSFLLKGLLTQVKGTGHYWP